MARLMNACGIPGCGSAYCLGQRPWTFFSFTRDKCPAGLDSRISAIAKDQGCPAEEMPLFGGLPLAYEI